MTLLELEVRDLALIERVRIEPDPGFTVITGETGAGKSLLIDALALVLGARADAGLVRSGASAARVQALFDRVPEPLICVREVTAAGRSTACVNDEAVSALRLAEQAGSLVEIHGQHDQQRLLDGAHQRDLLDAYGGHTLLRERVLAAVTAWRANHAALEALEDDPGTRARMLELHEHEADEIEAAALRLGEADEIRVRLTAAARAEQAARLVASIEERLAGEGGGAHDVLARVAREATELARLDPDFIDVAGRVDGLLAESDDLASELHRMSSELEHDPATVAALEERLGRIYALERKFGPDEATVLAHSEAARVAARRIRALDAERAERTTANVRLEYSARAEAAELTRGRTAAAERLAADVSRVLHDLGFRQARFEVKLAPGALGPAGAEAVQFLIAPNPGEPSLPLARIASGGELSRVSLAVKEVLAVADATPTLVFDEIDAGIGARSADRVGRSLRRLARAHQVLCVTHLAQIAAHADAHLKMEKCERNGRTVTEVRRLDGEERLSELAAMLGGDASGPAARAAAVELLERSTLGPGSETQ
ncbi:MAG: DNA repair protein RecN [Candidatus Limnocylindrales bacterium]